MKFYQSFKIRPEKSDDLPRVYITDYQDKEDHGGGAPSNSFSGRESVLRNNITVGIQLVVDSRNGWLTEATEERVKKMGILNIRAIILDELETNDAGEADCSLDGLLDKPIMFSTRESGVFDLGLVMDITVTLSPIRFNRKERSCLIEDYTAD